jgi:hypothetical protein
MDNIVFNNPKDIMAAYDTMYAEGYRAWGQSYQTMSDDLKFYLGDQWLPKEQKYLQEQGREILVINKLKSKIDWINGYQIQNRLSSVCVPVQDASQQTADQFTKLLINDLATSGYQKISECFSSSNKTGWNLLNVYLDFNTDPINGDVRFAKDPYSAFICDPYFTDLSNLSDCNWVIKRRYLFPQQAQVLLPGQEDEVAALARDGWERDNKFTWMVFQRIPTGQRMMAYNEFWQLKYEPVEVIYNKTTGMQVDHDGDDATLKMMLAIAKQQNHDLVMLTRQRQKVEKHIILNNTYIRTETNPYGLDEYPFVMMAPIFEPESEEYTYKVQSLIRLLRDPQRELNKRRSQMIDIVESRMNNGWIEMNGAVKNPKMLYESGQGKRIVLNDGFDLNSIREIPPSQIPPSFFQEFDLAEKDLMDILGLNPTTFGQVESKQVSALVEMQRQAAAIVGLQEVFDRLRDAQKSLSKKLIKIYQKWTPEKVAKILGEQPTREFYDRNFLKYDCQVQEGVLTNTQRYLFFRQVMELKQLGEPIPPGELTKLSPLQGKTEFMRDMEQFNKMQQQAQAQQAQVEQQREQAVAQSLQAKAVSDLALSKEREAKAISDLGLEDERISRGVRERQQGALDHIKGIKEIQIMDEQLQSAPTARAQDMLEFFQAYEMWLKQQEDQEKAENSVQSQSMAAQGSPAQPQGVPAL